MENMEAGGGGFGDFEGPFGGGFAQGFPGGGQPFQEDIERIFEQFFGGQPFGQSRRRGQDFRATVQLSFMVRATSLNPSRLSSSGLRTAFPAAPALPSSLALRSLK